MGIIPLMLKPFRVVKTLSFTTIFQCMQHKKWTQRLFYFTNNNLCSCKFENESGVGGNEKFNKEWLELEMISFNIHDGGKEREI